MAELWCFCARIVLRMDLTLLLIIVLAIFIILVIFIIKKLTDITNGQTPNSELLEYLKTTNTRLNEQSKNFNDRLDNAARIISQVQRNIGEFSEIGRGMKELTEFLNSPKLRGNVGEQVLKELLKQFLPRHSFDLQYTFKSGEKVDAIIKTSGGIIPVDSKFPMENFRRMQGKSDEDKSQGARDFKRDVRKHIDDISRKYVLVDEGTVDYALMYIPSEAVYYEIANDSDLFDFATEKRVLVVSPSTFYAYMKAILMSFEGQKIEKQAQEILSSLRAIQKDYGRVEENLSVLQKHLTNAYNMMGNVFSSFANLGQKISSTQRLGGGTKRKSEE